MNFDQLQNLREYCKDEAAFEHLQELLETALHEHNQAVSLCQQKQQQSLRFEGLLKQITDKIRDSSDEAQILQTVVQELTIALELYGCDIAIYDCDRGISTVQAEYIRSELSPALGAVFQMTNQTEVYNRLCQGSDLQICSISPYPDRVRDVDRPLSILAHPIVDNYQVLGDIWLFQKPDLAFSDLELRLVQQVASQCAIAIRQARLYQAFQGEVAKLEALNQLKDDFLSTVSHELRTPMTNIKMALQLLELAMESTENTRNSSPKNWQERDFLPIRSKVDRYLQILKAECEREIILLNQLLDLQQLESNAQPLLLEAIRLQDWLPELIEPFYDRAQIRRQTLQVDIPANLPALVSDPLTLGRIVTELLNNACKYTPPLERIRLTVAAEAEVMQIQVSNSGIEIPAAELPRIFDKFHRIPWIDQANEGGTGLGLALVKRSVEHLGGAIAVTTADGQTCFTIDLRLTRSENND